MPTPVRTPSIRKVAAACPACRAPLPDPEPIYREPAEVFEYWYNRFRAESPRQRPPLKWLAGRSRLPRSTCHWYRQRMEAAFPDAYAVAHAGKNLRLTKRRMKRPRTLSPSAVPESPPAVPESDSNLVPILES